MDKEIMINRRKKVRGRVEKEMNAQRMDEDWGL